MTTAAVYVRISSDPAGERAGVARQRDDCLALAEREGLTVGQVFEDNDISAYSGKVRPAFEAMMSAAGAGDFGTLIVWATDRLYRRLSDLVRITEELAGQVRILVVMEGEVNLTTAEGIMRAQITGSVAEFESRRRAERIKARAKQRAAEGVMTASNRPAGWRWADPCPGDDTCRHRTRCAPGQRARTGSRAGLLIDPDEAPVVAAAYRDIRDGRSLAAAWRRARDAGLELTAPTSLRAVLLNPRNAGLVAHKGAVVAENATGDRIIDPDTYTAVRAVLLDPARRTSGSKVAPPLGGGLAVCPKCGGNLAAGRKGDGHGNGTSTAAYVCSKHLHFTRRRHLLDGPVLDLVGQVLDAAAGQGLLAVATRDDPALAGVRSAIAATEERLGALAGLLAAGELDPADFAAATRRLRARLGQLTDRLARGTGRKAVAALGQDVPEAYRRLREAEDTDGLRALLADLLVEVAPQPDGSTRLEWQAWVGPAPSVIDPPGGPRLPDRDARRERVAQLHAEGLNLTQIAARTGVHRVTVRKDLRALGLRDERRVS